jgi:hypothetical protein
MALALLERDDRPADMRHDLPIPERRGIDGAARAGFVFPKKIFGIRDAPDHILMLPEAPAFGENPTDVFERVAPCDELPVEHAGNRPLVDEIVTGAVITVYESRLLPGRRIALAPA